MVRSFVIASAALLIGFGSATAVNASLLTNGGFEDLDGVNGPGDGWGAFGSAGFHNFFGANSHASLFADNVGNSGGIFQTGIVGTEGVLYRFSLLDTRIESNYDATTRFGLEFFAADDSTKIGESLATIADPGVEVNGALYSHDAIAPAGTAFVRPIIRFDNVLSSGGSRNVFVFDSSLAVVPEPATLGLVAAAGLLATRRRRA